ncbi:MAG TPA: carboxypeptidase-like regulatory domain-containing protein [Gaiellaceae bacterium]|nr:carboxypeptidase-like regulatory domain-containing protein [Gaiellaceae bacterium]
MHRPSPRLLALFLAIVSTAIGVAAASAASSSGWTRISGPAAPGVQLGLARGADGVLHVIWNRGATPTSIFETRFSAAGKSTGTSTVATGWNGNGGLALVTMPDKTLRLFAAGTDGIHTFTAPAAGKSWMAQAVGPWGGAVAEASAVIGATLTKDGQPVTAWRGNAAEGAPPASIPQNGYEGGMGESFLATDAATGAVVLSGETNAGQGGAYVQQILPSPGPKVLATPLAKDWSVSTSGRIGAAGVYFANADGKNVRFSRYRGSSKTLATGPYLSAALCAGPQGRLWVAWGDATDGLFLTRSSRAVGAFEPVQKLRAPSSNGLSYVQCEGSTGPVDLFANDGTGFWHTHLLAQLSVHAAASHGKVTVSARDAGDPVAGASVSVGGLHLKTGASGTVTLTLRPGSYSASVSAPGYATAKAAFHV